VSLLAQDERLTRRVGAVALSVLALAFVFFVFIYDRIEWGSYTRVKVYFHHVGSLREGAPFVVAAAASARSRRSPCRRKINTHRGRSAATRASS